MIEDHKALSQHHDHEVGGLALSANFRKNLREKQERGRNVFVPAPFAE